MGNENQKKINVLGQRNIIYVHFASLPLKRLTRQKTGGILNLVEITFVRWLKTGLKNVICVVHSKFKRRVPHVVGIRGSNPMTRLVPQENTSIIKADVAL
jgi:hypothetical protein